MDNFLEKICIFSHMPEAYLIYSNGLWLLFGQVLAVDFHKFMVFQGQNFLVLNSAGIFLVV